MNKCLILIAALAATMALTGCSGGAESEDNAAQVKKMSEKQAPSNNPDVAPIDAKNDEFGGKGKGGG